MEGQAAVLYAEERETDAMLMDHMLECPDKTFVQAGLRGCRENKEQNRAHFFEGTIGIRQLGQQEQINRKPRRKSRQDILK